MITHVVMFRLKEDKKDEAQILRDRLMELPDRISEIRHYELGINMIESDRNFDACLYSQFNSMNDLQVYQVHPAHVEVLDYVKSVAAQVVVTDYES